MKQIVYRSGFKYVLDEEYAELIPIYPNDHIDTKWVVLTIGGLLTLKAGFGYDGPSGPTIDTRSAMRAAAKHDGIYRLLRLGLLDERWRLTADEIYESDCIKDSKIARPKWIPAMIYEPLAQARFEAHFKALRLFGTFAARRGTEPIVLRAP